MSAEWGAVVREIPPFTKVRGDPVESAVALE
jgi:hypothetical protein